MIVPEAELIEWARDMVKTLPDEQQKAQLKEFKFAVGNTTPEMEQGYLIGLQVARAWAATNPKLQMDSF